jgi:murein DD-endopeptidase MepM/ murein hydrolase activator NlpD
MGFATIWNQNTGEKRRVVIGEPVPQGFSLWTGGNATGQQAREAIFNNMGAANSSGSAADGISRPGGTTDAGAGTPGINYQDFGVRLMGLLQKQQQLGTSKFVNAQIGAQQEQVNRTMAENTSGAPYSNQATERNAAVNAVQPTVTGAGNLGKTFGEQITGVGNAINNARSFMQEMQAAEEKKQADAFNLVMNSFDKIGAGAFADLDPKEIATLEKTAGLPTGFIDKATKAYGTTKGEWEFKSSIGKDSMGNDIPGWVNSSTQEVKAANGGAAGQPGQPTTPSVQSEVSLEQYTQWLGGSVTQGFSDPAIAGTFTDGRTTHGGYDISGKLGQAVSAPISGKVVEITKGTTGWGNSILIQDAQGNKWRLAHFQDLAVTKGENVMAGQAVGYLGNTGTVLKGDGTKPTPAELAAGRGTHLHMEVKDASGKLVDPFGGNAAAGPLDLDNSYLAALAALPTQMKNSDAEKAIIRQFVAKQIDNGETNLYNIVDKFLGYFVDKPDDFSNAIRDQFGKGEFSSSEIMNIARNINKGNREGAVTIVENKLMNAAKALDPDGYVGESFVRTATTQAKNIETAVAGARENPISVTKGTMEDFLGRLRGADAQKIKTKITQAVAEMRSKLAGVAVTETELKFLNDLVPQIYDSPQNFMSKLKNLRTNPLLQLNSIRGTLDIPALTEESLFNKALRADLYTGQTTGAGSGSGVTGTTSSGLSYTIIPN